MMNISRKLLLLSAFAGGIFFLHAVEAFEAPKNPAPEEINQAFGIPLFSENNLWNEPDRNVAERLVLNLESKTSYESGYRLYPGEGASILGLRPFSVFLQGLGGKAARFSLIFANKGDVAAYASAADLRHAASSGDGEIPVTPQPGFPIWVHVHGEWGVFCDFLSGQGLCKPIPSRNGGFSEPPHGAVAVFGSRSAFCPG